MVDTYGALILTHLIVGLPIIIWVMISFFEDVPGDLEDAGLIDGCSYFGVFWRIALPLVKPGIVGTAILSFVFSWNNLLFSVILAGRETRTLPIAVYNMTPTRRSTGAPWPRRRRSSPCPCCSWRSWPSATS